MYMETGASREMQFESYGSLQSRHISDLSITNICENKWFLNTLALVEGGGA